MEGTPCPLGGAQRWGCAGLGVHTRVQGSVRCAAGVFHAAHACARPSAHVLRGARLCTTQTCVHVPSPAARVRAQGSLHARARVQIGCANWVCVHSSAARQAPCAGGALRSALGAHPHPTVRHGPELLRVPIPGGAQGQAERIWGSPTQWDRNDFQLPPTPNHSLRDLHPQPRARPPALHIPTQTWDTGDVGWDRDPRGSPGVAALWPWLPPVPAALGVPAPCQAA